MPLLDTEHARELVPPAIVKLSDGEGEARIERLRIKSTGAVQLRLSWWLNGAFIPRPLELAEEDFLKLVAEAIRRGVLLPNE